MKVKRRWHDTLTLLYFLFLALRAVWTQKSVHVEWKAQNKTISISFLHHLLSGERMSHDRLYHL